MGDRMKRPTGITEKELDTMLQICIETEIKHPIIWHWRFTRRFPFIEKYTVLERWSK
jgi:hypothetical protein